MKPFDLEAAKRGEPIQTRDGRPAKFIAYVPEAKKSRRVIVFIGSLPVFRHEDGTVWTQDVDHASELVMAPRKRTLWLNVYVSGGHYTAGVHRTKEHAEQSNIEGITPRRIGDRAWPLEIEE
jgi:hypothetical protein